MEMMRNLSRKILINLFFGSHFFFTVPHGVSLQLEMYYKRSQARRKQRLFLCSAKHKITLIGQWWLYSGENY